MTQGGYAVWMAKQPKGHPVPVRGELDGKVYTGQDLLDLMDRGTQRELSRLIVTYSDGMRIRPGRFCERIVSLETDENGATIIRL